LLVVLASTAIDTNMPIAATKNSLQRPTLSIRKSGTKATTVNVIAKLALSKCLYYPSKLRSPKTILVYDTKADTLFYCVMLYAIKAIIN
jgi:hypothetical protein